MTPRGRPHAAVTIGACLDGAIHFAVAPESVLGRNIERDARIAFSVCDRSHVVMGQGMAVLAGRARDEPELITRLAGATDAGSFTPPGWDGLIYRIRLERIFAN